MMTIFFYLFLVLVVVFIQVLDNIKNDRAWDHNLMMNEQQIKQEPPHDPLLEAYISLGALIDRKSTRLNSSHVRTSYAVFCLKKKQSGTGRRRRAAKERSRVGRHLGVRPGVEARQTQRTAHREEQHDHPPQHVPFRHRPKVKNRGRSHHEAEKIREAVEVRSKARSGFQQTGHPSIEAVENAGRDNRKHRALFFLVHRKPPRSTLFPYTTLFR